ncbi:TPR domain family protein [Desulforapulum autotrophicum HRM2]|uniref:TPR domain family protein n=1 Tax=Desulforapulum autotrophicum (strain ATCC 43914 / DSM 3382 / VKM B-1955 / HRM2) TaxID=177437 RepID=C0QLG3_DESAH|nr:M48 family metallopeptidase [Desulforapulum autotrophicum]ACN16267.1 TPR domain family protein [Desulforapulum autotrophicum HRM2]
MKPFRHTLAGSLIAALLVFFISIPPAAALSVSEERKMAQEFMEMVGQQMALIHDPMALDLVSLIGRRIVDQLPPQPFDYTFHIVDSDQFNAFAGPGANIFVNRGLITGLDNSDELAGIIGHECAHAACRHISQMLDRSKLVSIGTLAGVLAGVLVGVAGGGDAAQAVVLGSVASGQTSMLAYSRENEEEADQKGVKYIRDASFSPRGLLTGLEKIRASDWYGTDAIPAYLKTHPGSKDRILYLEAWLQDHANEAVTNNGIDPFRFNLVKYRLAGLYGQVDTTEAMLSKMLKKDPDDAAIHYGLALVLVRKSLLDQALSHLGQALTLRLFDPFVLVEMGRVYLLKGEPEKALAVLEGLDTVADVRSSLLFYRGSARLDLGMLDKAKSDLLRLVDADPDLFPRVYYNLADISGQEHEVGLSHYYLGFYYHTIKEERNALFHFEKSLGAMDDPDRIERAKALISELKKKNKAPSSRGSSTSLSVLQSGLVKP